MIATFLFSKNNFHWSVFSQVDTTYRSYMSLANQTSFLGGGEVREGCDK